MTIRNLITAALLASTLPMTAVADESEPFIYRTKTTGVIERSEAAPTNPDPDQNNPSPTATPDIADQSRTVLGKGGQQITAWNPVAPEGWAASVVSADTKSAFKGNEVTFSSNYDLSIYGLTLDTKSGMISGTPTAEGFVIPDFKLTATTDGGSDTTAAFWLGVEPEADMSLSPSQPTSYYFVEGENVITDPIIVYNAVGAVTFTRPDPVAASNWNSNTGVASLGIVNTGSSTVTTNYTTTATDEFARELVIPFSISKYNFKIATTSATDIMVRALDTKDWKTVSATGQVGTVTFSSNDLPPGMRLEFLNSRWRVMGTYVGSLADLGREYSSTITATDTGTGKTVHSQMVFKVVTPLMMNLYLNGNGYVPDTIKRGGTSNVSGTIYSGGNYGVPKAYEPKVTVASGTIPAGLTPTVNASGSLYTLTGTVTASAGTYTYTLKLSDNEGYSTTTPQLTTKITN